MDNYICNNFQDLNSFDWFFKCFQWDIYSCMLGKASGGKTKLWLKDYSNLITKNYPAEIKSKIDIEIENLKSMRKSVNYL